MRSRRFGRTNLQLSLFSLGTMRYLASADTAYHTLQRAVDLGINHIETARGYGHSEEYLGLALRQGLSVPRTAIAITSKAPPTPDADALERSLDTSLLTLGIDYLDGFALHGLNTEEHLQWVLQPGGCLERLRRAIADGRIRHIGFSTHGPLELILRAIATDQFEFVNLHYTLFFQRNAPAIQLAHERDMGVFIISPADKGGLLYTPPPTLVDLCAPLTPLMMNYRWLLSDRRITTLSIGPAHPSELEAPLQSADRDGPLTVEELAILTRLEQHQQSQLGRDRCSQCYQCLPCPEAIQIPEVLRLRNLAIAYDMTTYGQYRYGMFENAGHWFPGRKASRCTDCGDCLPRCPEQLDIPTLLRDTHDRLSGPSRRRLWE